MCIVSVVRNENDFIITHNRDEDFSRASSPELVSENLLGQNVQYPKDLRSGGTWFLNAETFVSCILNGAFQKVMNKAGKKSRGILPFQILNYPSIKDYYDNVDLHGFEPFTQLIFQKDKHKVQLLIWDKEKKYVKECEDKLVVISSSNLYTEDDKIKNINFLRDVKRNEPSPEKMAVAHEKLKMNAGDVHPMVKTTSITQVSLFDGVEQIIYKTIND